MSMAWNAARKLRRIVANLARIQAVELVVASRAVELRAHPPAAGTGAVITRLRRQVPGAGPDRFTAPELERAAAMVRSGEILDAAVGATLGID